MIKSIQFSEGVLRLAISLPRVAASSERQRSVQFDFGERGAIAELHRSELMHFLYSIDTKGTYEIGYFVFELLAAHSTVRRIHINCFYGGAEALQGGAALDVPVEFTSGTVEHASSEKDIPF